jgi:DNA polymerase (family 10)
LLNAEIAEALNEIADIHDVLGDRYRPRAYRRAARSVENSSADLIKLMESRQLTTIPGVGENIASKIEEFIQTGTIAHLEKLRGKITRGVSELLKIPDIGPKTAMLLYEQLGISSMEDLEAAVRDQRLRAIKGMGEKTESNIIRGIRLVERGAGRMLLGQALPIAEELKEHMMRVPGVGMVSLAGSIRRMKETVGDVDLLVTASSPQSVADAFVSMPMVRDTLVKGDTKSSVLLTNGLQVDMRIVPEESFGAALQYFTGSKDHNIKLREMAQRRELKLSEYGLFDSDGLKVAGGDEEGIYRYLGMSYVEPELRENTGEIEAAMEGRLPTLVTVQDMLGDFHVHSSWSDGRQGISAIAINARKLGYDFICITDHSKTLQIAHGLDEEGLLRQGEEISRLNLEMSGGPVILSGIEVDITARGSLDTSDEALGQLDVVIGSVHSGFKSDEESMTRRIVDALSTGLLHILGHPTGRLLGKRDPYPMDEERVFDAAAQHGVMMEINAFPDRLDLNDRMAKRAGEMGLKLAIGTDAHDVEQMRYLSYGVSVARRAWLGKESVANCLTVDEVRALLAG